MLPVNPGGHAAYQNFVVTNLRKYYPNPNAFSRVTWDTLNVSGILIFLIPMNFYVQNTLSLVQSQEPLPVCSIPICCPFISKFIHSQTGLLS